MADNNLNRTLTENNKVTVLTLSAIKDFILAKGGKVRYAELFDHFRNLIVDSSSGFEYFLYIYFLIYLIFHKYA
jgi:hypothetical protein